jgi:hypothetical protein
MQLGDDIYAGAGRNVCYTAFAGVALKCPVAMRCSRLLLSRTQGGVTDIRACTCVDSVCISGHPARSAILGGRRTAGDEYALLPNVEDVVEMG